MKEHTIDDLALPYVLQEILDRMVRIESKISAHMTAQGLDSFGRKINRSSLSQNSTQ